MCKSERNVTSLCACNELHMMYTAGELKQSWQKSHHPVQKRQPCNLVVSMYEVTEQRISCVLEHGSEMCVHIRVCLHMYCLSVVYLCKGVLVHACVCVCAFTCMWACWDRSKRHTCRLGEQLEAQWEDGRITLRLLLHACIVLLEKCVCLCERETHSFLQYLCSLHVWFPLFARAAQLLSFCVV